MLSQYDLIIEHRPGRKHANADALSRGPDHISICENYELGVLPSDLPCGGCHYCERAHSNWSVFANLVDDVIPLSRRKETPITAELSDICVTNLEIELDEDPKLLVNGMEVGDPSISHVSVNSGESDLKLNFYRSRLRILIFHLCVIGLRIRPHQMKVLLCCGVHVKRLCG